MLTCCSGSRCSFSLMCNTSYTVLPRNSIYQCLFFSFLSAKILWVSRCYRCQLSSSTFTLHMFIQTPLSNTKDLTLHCNHQMSNVEVWDWEFECWIPRLRSSLLWVLSTEVHYSPRAKCQSRWWGLKTIVRGKNYFEARTPSHLFCHQALNLFRGPNPSFESETHI